MKRRRFIGAALATASTPLIAGCGSGGGDGDDNGNGGDTNGDQTTTTVAPMRLSVEPGAEVTWRNDDAYSHTLSAGQFHDKAVDWSKNERISPNGGQAKHTFEEAGVYEYYCSIHGKSEMCGVVLVGDVSLDASLPCEG
jgi:plastocyanin